MYGWGWPSAAVGSHNGVQIGLPLLPNNVVPTTGFAGAIDAVEPDPEELARLRERLGSDPRVTIVDVDAVALADADLGAPFDSAICFNVLEHIADDAGALRAVRSKLRPGGALLLLVPAH